MLMRINTTSFAIPSQTIIDAHDHEEIPFQALRPISASSSASHLPLLTQPGKCRPSGSVSPGKPGNGSLMDVFITVASCLI